MCDFFFSTRCVTPVCALSRPVCAGQLGWIRMRRLVRLRKNWGYLLFLFLNHFNQRVTNRRQSSRPNCGLQSGTKRKLVNFFLRYNSGIVYSVVLTTGPVHAKSRAAGRAALRDQVKIRSSFFSHAVWLFNRTDTSWIWQFSRQKV